MNAVERDEMGDRPAPDRDAETQQSSRREAYGDALGTSGPQPSSPDADPRFLDPLPGEPGIPDVNQRRRVSISGKGLFAVGLLLIGLLAMVAYGLHRFDFGGDKAASDPKLVGDRPSAATNDPRRLDLTVAAPAASAGPATTPRVPELLPGDPVVEPIGVRRTGSGTPTGGSPKGVAPEDAPVLLVTSRPGAVSSTYPGAPGRRSPPTGNAVGPAPGTTPAGVAMTGGSVDDVNADPLAATTSNLQDYQRQLQGLLEQLMQSAAMATGQSTGRMPAAALSGDSPGLSLGGPPAGGNHIGGTLSGAPGGAGLFGGQLQGSPTPRVAAGTLGNRSLTLPKGTGFTCALKTRVISATSGLVGCQVQRNVYSDDGRVLLIERGSHLDGEYRIASVRPGMVRIPVLWTRIRTPLGVTVDIDSPGTGRLGESGIDGYVDNRWVERIGAALLLSLIDDSVKLVIQNQSNDASGGTVVLPSTTSNSSKLAEKVLDSTINIPPLIVQNQGGIVGIYVARDVDFSSVYELRPTSVTTKSVSADGLPTGSRQ